MEFGEFMLSRNSTFPVNLKSVDEISEMVYCFLLDCDVERGISLRMRLVVEEMLIFLVDHCGKETEMDITLSKRFGKPWVTMTYGGEKADPTDRQDQDMVSDMILNRLRIEPKWSYRKGLNRITLSVPSSGVRKEFHLIGAVVLAVLLGVCAPFIPAGVRDALIQFFLTPVSDIFMKLLMILAPLLIFLSVINSIIRSGQEADFGRLGKYVITRYVVITAVASSLFTLVLIPFFQLHFEETASSSSSFQKIYELLINIVPGSIIQPFSENNTMQIIILAIFLGVIIINLDNRLETLRSTMLDLDALFLCGIEMISHILPLFVFASLLKLFWETGLADFAKMWKPIFAATIVAYSYVLAVGILVSLKNRMSLITLFRKVFPTFLIGIATNSSLMAMTSAMEINKKRLGIDDRYTSFALPLALSMHVGVFCPLFLSITYYLAEIYNVAVSPVWFFTAGLICMIICFATPPVSGGALICLGIIMGRLNIPSEGLAIAGTLALIIDFIITGAKVLAHHFEMILQSDHLQMIDKEILRDPEKM